MQKITKLRVMVFISVMFLIITRQTTAQMMPNLPANQLVLPSKPYTIYFKWHRGSANGQPEPYLALLLPVNLPGCPQQFYMQFDTGAPYSVFYNAEIEKIRAKYPAVMSQPDSTGILKNCTFKLGEMPVTAKEIIIKNVNGSSGNEQFTIIGTIGTDFIDGRVIMIDYPNQAMFTGTELPSKLTMEDFMYAGRSILLPARIAGKNTMLFFDTGSSAFELITSKESASLLAAPGAEAVQYPVQSWNKVLTANTLAATGHVQMAGQAIPLKQVSFIEGASAAQIEQMTKMGIGGMTGNKLFINYTLVLDMKSKKFALLQKKS